MPPRDRRAQCRDRPSRDGPHNPLARVSRCRRRGTAQTRARKREVRGARPTTPPIARRPRRSRPRRIVDRARLCNDAGGPPAGKKSNRRCSGKTGEAQEASDPPSNGQRCQRRPTPRCDRKQTDAEPGREQHRWMPERQPEPWLPHATYPPGGGGRELRAAAEQWPRPAPRCPRPGR